MQFLQSLAPFAACALMGVVCVALMHRSHGGSESSTDGPGAAQLRDEVSRLQAEVSQLRAERHGEADRDTHT